MKKARKISRMIALAMCFIILCGSTVSAAPKDYNIWKNGTAEQYFWGEIEYLTGALNSKAHLNAVKQGHETARKEKKENIKFSKSKTYQHFDKLRDAYDSMSCNLAYSNERVVESFVSKGNSDGSFKLKAVVGWIESGEEPWGTAYYVDSKNVSNGKYCCSILDIMSRTRKNVLLNDKLTEEFVSIEDFFVERFFLGESDEEWAKYKNIQGNSCKIEVNDDNFSKNKTVYIYEEFKIGKKHVGFLYNQYGSSAPIAMYETDADGFGNYYGCIEASFNLSTSGREFLIPDTYIGK